MKHDRDEHYVIRLCNELLRQIASRQHRFDFLRGDPNKKGTKRRLPVDAFYTLRNLVIEYRERQHTERVAIMDERPTVSGCSRGEQRIIYDQRRRDELPKHGLRLVEIGYRLFKLDSRKRIKRDPVSDKRRLRGYLRSLGVRV